MLGRIIWGLAISIIGAACCYYSYQLVSAFWRNDWMERNLWGTRNGIVLFGVFLVIIWILMVFGVFSIANPTDQIPQGYWPAWWDAVVE